ncbi:MAG: peroxiredoxin [bacterium]
MKELEGTKAPDFALEGSDGKRHALRDYRGRTVVLYFYPKDDTPGCTLEACSFRDLNDRFREAGVAVFGISKDGLDAHGKFVSKYGLSFILLSDPEAKTLQDYAAWGEKNLYGKKVTGAIRSTVVIGPDGKIVKHWPQVKDAGAHPAEVLRFLEGRG